MFVAHTAVKINVPYGRAKLKDSIPIIGQRSRYDARFTLYLSYILAFISRVVWLYSLTADTLYVCFMNV